MITNETVNVCDFCNQEVSAQGDDAIYVCEEHGIVEAYWHTIKESECDNV